MSFLTGIAFKWLLPLCAFLVLISMGAAQVPAELPPIDICPLPKDHFVDRVIMPMGGSATPLLSALQPACAAVVGGIPVILKVNRLDVKEYRRKGHLWAGICLNMDVVSYEEGRLRWLYNVGTAFQSDGGADDAEKRANAVKEALVHCLGSFTRAWVEGRCDTITVNEEWLERSTHVDEIRLPVLRMTPLPKGLIDDLGAFRQGHVRTVKDADISVGNNDRLRLSDDAHAARDLVWGISDGKRCFMRVGNAFLPLEQDSLGFVTMVESQGDPGIAAGVVVMFGLIGGLVYAGAAEEIMQLRLDLMTGELFQTNGADRLSTPSATHVIHYSRFAKSHDPITIVHGTQQFTLDKGSYCEVHIVAGGAPVNVLLENGSGTTALPLPRNFIGRSLHLIEADEGGAPVIMKVNRQMEGSILEKLPIDRRRMHRWAVNGAVLNEKSGP